MAKDISVTLTTSTLKNGAGTVSFTVANNSPLPLNIEVTPGPAELPTPTEYKPATAAWLSVSGDNRFSIPIGGNHVFDVTVKLESAPAAPLTPKGKTPPTYMFVLNAASVEMPNDHWGKSDPVPVVGPVLGGRHMNWWLIAGTAAVVLLAVGIGTWMLTRSAGKPIQNEVGVAYSKAKAALEADGFTVAALPTTQAGSTDDPVVTAMSPAADDKKKYPAKTEVKLSVAWTSPVTVTTTAVPDLHGSRVDEARRILDKARLKLGNISLRTSRETENTVIETAPDTKSAPVPFGTSVDVVLATPATADLGDLTSMTDVDAVKYLNKAGFHFDLAHEESVLTSGTVIRQFPLPGHFKITQPVTITMATPLIMPMFPAFQAENVRIFAMNHGIKFNQSTKRVFNMPPGTFLELTPKAGTKLGPGDEINLTVTVR